MATTKIWSVKKRIDKAVNYVTNKQKTKNDCYEYGMDRYANIRDVLNYVTNADKTEKQYYVTGINCKVEDAVEKMQFAKMLFGKEGGILAFHGEQSFKEGEVTPELAHEIGVKLAEEMWGDRFQVIVTTHLNTKHIHNHFLLNSVSFKDGYRYYSNFTNTAILRKTSDEICEEYGLSVLKEKKCKSGINFENFYKKDTLESEYCKFAKEDLDYAIKHSYTLKDFEKMLVSMGYYYQYRAGKLSIRRYDTKRNIRVERRFGEEYSLDNIKDRILENEFVPEEKVIPYKTLTSKFYKSKDKIKRKYKPKGIVALYYYYRFLLGLYPKKNVPHKLTPEMRAEIKKMDKYSEEIRFICKYKVENMKDLRYLEFDKQEELQKVLNKRNSLYRKRSMEKDEDKKDLITKAIIGVSKEVAKIRKDLKICDEMQLKVYKMQRQLKEMDERKVEKEKDKKKLKIK